MRILVVYSHPNPESFNHAILEHLVEGLSVSDQEVDIADLYATRFNPVLQASDLIQFRKERLPEDVIEQQKKISAADVIIFIHPTWWGGMPAMVKGYIDRVFTLGFAYRMGKDGPKGLLVDKKMIFVRTTALPKDAYVKSGVENLIRSMLTYQFVVVCGVKALEHHVFYEVPSVSDEIRQGYLKKAKELGRYLHT